MSLSNYIHETDDFAVTVGPLQSKGDFHGLVGYLVVNKRHQVVEGEMTVEFAAIRAMRDLQMQLEAALANKPSEATVEQTEVSFPEMLERLQNRQVDTE